VTLAWDNGVLAGDALAVAAAVARAADLEGERVPLSEPVVLWVAAVSATQRTCTLRESDSVPALANGPGRASSTANAIRCAAVKLWTATAPVSTTEDSIRRATDIDKATAQGAIRGATLPAVAACSGPSRTTIVVDADVPRSTDRALLRSNGPARIWGVPWLAKAILAAPVAELGITKALITSATPARTGQATLRSTFALLLRIAGSALGTRCTHHAVRSAEAGVINKAQALVARSIGAAAIRAVGGIALAAALIAKRVKWAADDAI
jgi:hypothetical protein